MAAIFPPSSKGGVPPGGGVAFDYVPTHPVVGEGPLFVASDCSTALTADQMNGLTSEILAAVDILGFSYNSTLVTNLGNALFARFDAVVAVAGDTMTGPLTLSGPPTDPLHAASKSYVDSSLTTAGSSITAAYQAADAALQSQINGKVAKSGDTMTGFLTLVGVDPTAPYHAASKIYVDNKIATAAGEAPSDGTTYGRKDLAWVNVLPLAGGTLTGPLHLATDPLAGDEAATKNYVDTEIAANTIDIDTKVSKSGDVMTGMLSLPGVPTAPEHAATKQYVDAADAAIITTQTGIRGDLDNKVNRYGDVMTGALTLNGDPVNALHAASKQYVDAFAGTVTNRVLRSGDTMTGYLTLVGDPGNDLHAATKRYVDINFLRDAPSDGNTYGRQNNVWVPVTGGSGGGGAYLPLSGGTMTGFITLVSDPTSSLHSATKQYVDARVAKAGDTMLGALTLAADPTVPMHAATKQYSDLKLARAGGTMTGPLTLAADPAADMQAATRLYVDTSANGRVLRGGDTMTGLLTLSGDPANPLHAASKQYVDAVAGGRFIGEIIPYAGNNLPAKCLWPDGRNVSRTTFAALFNAISISITGTTAVGSANITAVFNANSEVLAKIAGGGFHTIEGPGIPVGATITSYDSGTGIIVMSIAATASASGVAIRIYPHGRGNGTTTFGLPDLRGRTINGRDNMGGTAASRLTHVNSRMNGTVFGLTGGDERIQQHVHWPANAVAVQLYTSNYATSLAPTGEATWSVWGTTGYVNDVAVGGSGNVGPTTILDYVIYAGV
jgi:hypothetical protein